MEQQYELTSTPPPPELVSLAAYVAEDGLVGHHWETRPLGFANFICLSTARAKRWEWVGRGVWGGGYGGLLG